jgi:hypothetical protein
MTPIPNLVSTQLTTSEILFLFSICNPRYKSPVAGSCSKLLHPTHNVLCILSCFPWFSGKPGVSLPNFCMSFFPEEPRWSVMCSKQRNRQTNTKVYAQRKPRDTQTNTQIKHRKDIATGACSWRICHRGSAEYQCMVDAQLSVLLLSLHDLSWGSSTVCICIIINITHWISLK